MDWPRFKPAKSLLDCYSANKMTQFVFPLRDTFIRPLKLVRSLVNFMALSENRKNYDEDCAHSTGFTMAKSFAMAPAKAHGPCMKVGALPEMLFKTAGMVARIVTELWPFSDPTFKEGEWSIVLINEHQSPFHKRPNIRDAFRLAVITLKAKDKDDGFRVLSIEEFLKDVMGEGSGAAADDVVAAMEYWKNTTSRRPKSTSYCRFSKDIWPICSTATLKKFSRVFGTESDIRTLQKLSVLSQSIQHKESRSPKTLSHHASLLSITDSFPTRPFSPMKPPNTNV